MTEKLNKLRDFQIKELKNRLKTTKTMHLIKLTSLENEEFRYNLKKP